jgi:CheY-like chemotaxis protein
MTPFQATGCGLAHRDWRAGVECRASAETSEDPPLPDAPLAGFRLLVVEDDADTQEALRSIFELKGAAVTTASSALEGFQSFLRLRPDVIVCDLGLPGADGYALIRQIRELPPVMGGATAAVAVTAYSAEMTPKVLHAGFQAHLHKPVDPDDLVKTVAALALKARQ